MEKFTSEQAASFETPAVQLLAEHRHTLWLVRNFLDSDMADPPRILYQFEYQQDFLHAVYETDDFWSTMQAARCGDQSSNLSDFQIWHELSWQARHGFDEENNPMWNGKFWLDGIDEMSNTAKITGAAIAAEDVFARFAEGSHDRDETLARLQSVCELDDAVMRDIIRLLAMPVNSESVQHISNAIFTEAVLRPEGLVRRAVANAEGQIDTAYFGGPDIIDKNLTRSFHAVIDRIGGSTEEFEAFRRDYPDEYQALVESPAFLEAAHLQLRGSFTNLPRHEPAVPEIVFSVIPRENAAMIAQITYEGLRNYVDTWEADRKASGGFTKRIDLRLLKEEFGIGNYSAGDYIYTYLRNLRSITDELTQSAAN